MRNDSQAMHDLLSAVDSNVPNDASKISQNDVSHDLVLHHIMY